MRLTTKFPGQPAGSVYPSLQGEAPISPPRPPNSASQTPPFSRDGIGRRVSPRRLDHLRFSGSRRDRPAAEKPLRDHLFLMADELEELLSEQVAYYRALAPKCEVNSPWPYDTASRAALSAALDEFQPRGDVLEFACGPGVWTENLAAYASRLDALDFSPEMLAIASARVRQEHVNFIQGGGRERVRTATRPRRPRFRAHSCP